MKFQVLALWCAVVLQAGAIGWLWTHPREAEPAPADGAGESIERIEKQQRRAEIDAQVNAHEADEWRAQMAGDLDQLSHALRAKGIPWSPHSSESRDALR